ncbi:MAG: glucose 1-dehydrogenase [Phycisphaerae bacterium]|nr:glucose 1-dehydrogenase [Phycisphaerae bacterium]
MKSIAVFPAVKDIRVVEKPEPRLAASSDVKLRSLEVGICGTDREISSFHYGLPPRGQDHLVIGHEMLGEVVDVGDGVRTLVPGDLVVPMVRRPCPHDWCSACRAGRQDFCYSGDFVERGIKEMHGFMGEYVVDDERFMVKVPRDLRDVAVLVEPLTIAEKALIQLHDVQMRLPWTCPIMSRDLGLEHRCHRAVVLGAGPVGLLGAMAMRARGFETWVYSRERGPSLKSDIVRAVGATYVSSEETPVEALAAEIGNIDLVYEAVGASSLAFRVLESLGTNGVFVMTGVPGRMGPIDIDADLLMRNLVLKNQVLLGTVNAGLDAFEAALADLRRFKSLWPDALVALFTNRLRIDAAPGKLRDGRGSIKDVITYG